MANLEFKIVDKRFFKMTANERIAAMNKIHDDQRNAAQNPQQSEDGWGKTINPFPKWLKDLIKQLQRDNGGTSLKFDGDNKIYLLYFKGDMDVADDLLEEFKEAYENFLKNSTAEAVVGKSDAIANEEIRKWLEDWHPQVSVHMEDEGDAMRELEDHYSSRAPARRVVKKKSKKA